MKRDPKTAHRRASARTRRKLTLYACAVVLALYVAAAVAVLRPFAVTPPVLVSTAAQASPAMDTATPDTPTTPTARPRKHRATRRHRHIAPVTLAVRSCPCDCGSVSADVK